MSIQCPESEIAKIVTVKDCEVCVLNDICPDCAHELTVAANGDTYCNICGYECAHGEERHGHDVQA